MSIRGSRLIALLLLALANVACEGAPTAPADQQAAGVDAVDADDHAASLEHTTWPSAADPGPPFYARIEFTPPHFLIAGEWAVVPFFRDPSCIPENFNLLRLFDPPAVFGCPLVVSGFALWEEVGVAAPRVSVASGTDVPVWLIPADAALAAIEDDVLTIGELATLPGRLVGEATRFRELLHPTPFFGRGGHANPKLTIDARGTLEDGRDFRYRLTRVRGQVRSTAIDFR